jgi:hypothetical protein
MDLDGGGGWTDITLPTAFVFMVLARGGLERDWRWANRLGVDTPAVEAVAEGVDGSDWVA